ncbi:hypothetical protein [Streptomyces sp. DW26H14]|uniref:hypothetical protein n=1 Tax=Streptomyces sp. DW26H14 TaxID=3435395 RepID=UPI00403E2EDF
MPEDPIAQSEMAALTRRYEEAVDRVDAALAVVKSDVLHLRVEAGSAATRLASIEDAVSALDQKIDRNQAQIVELLTGLVGRGPEQLHPHES